MFWSCYIIRSLDPNHTNKTYVGSSNDINRRLRQHNREICGGAKATGIGYPYEHYCVLSGFIDHQSALACEWLLKHPDGKIKRNSKYNGVNGRIKGLNYLLTQSEKWNHKKKGANLDIKIKDDVYGLLELDKITDTVTIDVD